MTVPRTGYSLRAVQAEQDSEYSSDEDECTSDQDDRGPAYESDDDDGYDRIANDDLDALMRCFDDEDAELTVATEGTAFLTDGVTGESATETEGEGAARPNGGRSVTFQEAREEHVLLPNILILTRSVIRVIWRQSRQQISTATGSALLSLPSPRSRLPKARPRLSPASRGRHRLGLTTG